MCQIGSSVVARFNHFVKLGNSLPERGSQLVSAYAAYWQSAASQLAPVDTGDLKNSVGFQMEGPHQARISVGMNYGIHQEFGTMDMPAQPFLRPARASLAAPFQRDLKGMLKP
jgi:HK97 gp10 family phage protein